MSRSSSLTPLSRDFDTFLRAPIDEDGNGTLLSVLSGLARLDIDAWQEAANLSKLPREAATLRLASLIGALPEGRSIHRNPTTIAVRLIALLPRGARPIIPPARDPPARIRPGGMAEYIALAIASLMLLMAALGSQQIQIAQSPAAHGVPRVMSLGATSGTARSSSPARSDTKEGARPSLVSKVTPAEGPPE